MNFLIHFDKFSENVIGYRSRNLQNFCRISAEFDWISGKYQHNSIELCNTQTSMMFLGKSTEVFGEILKIWANCSVFSTKISESLKNTSSEEATKVGANVGQNGGVFPPSSRQSVLLVFSFITRAERDLVFISIITVQLFCAKRWVIFDANRERIFWSWHLIDFGPF